MDWLAIYVAVLGSLSLYPATKIVMQAWERREWYAVAGGVVMCLLVSPILALAIRELVA